MIEIVQAIITIFMFLIGTIQDLKSRSVSDVVWIIFGVSGLSVTLVGTEYVLLTGIVVVLCIGASFLVWRLGVIGTADFFAMIVFSVTMPRFAPIEFVPIIVMICVMVCASAYTVIINLKRNITDIVSGNFFYDVDESIIKKIAASFFIHKKRRSEKFTFPGTVIVDGKTKFVFFHDPNSQEFDDTADYVCLAVPLMPFFLTVTIALVFFIKYLSFWGPSS